MPNACLLQIAEAASQSRYDVICVMGETNDILRGNLFPIYSSLEKELVQLSKKMAVLLTAVPMRCDLSITDNYHIVIDKANNYIRELLELSIPLQYRNLQGSLGSQVKGSSTRGTPAMALIYLSSASININNYAMNFSSSTDNKVTRTRSTRVSEDELSALMSSPIATTALQIGLDLSRVKMAIRQKLEQTGLPFSTADDLIEATLDIQLDEVPYQDTEETWYATEHHAADEITIAE
ncbi:Baculoviral IAP repeat-containing protein 2 [Homalodisca vitripennis]|nr:Baculoviral IAP repeat-containing protein 2 [Homalodisca vitripennis]